MHNRTLKKLALALTFWITLHAQALRAQLIYTNNLPFQTDSTGSNPVDFEFRADGTLIVKGNLGVGTLLSTDQGTGSRMLWFPALGAFRAGTINTNYNSGTNWNLNNIGEYSTALGLNVTASGVGSLALGTFCTASQQGAVAIGASTASGPNSLALGGCTASSEGSCAIGSESSAIGYNTVAIGVSSDAVANGSLALGCGNTATGSYAAAIGTANTASGVLSTAMGNTTSASGYSSFVIGRYNLDFSSTGTAPNASQWNPNDPLLEVGNGSPSTGSAYYGNYVPPILSNALVIYKSGDAVFSPAPGTTSCTVYAPVFMTTTAGGSGDIPMYTGH